MEPARGSASFQLASNNFNPSATVGKIWKLSEHQFGDVEGLIKEATSLG